MVLQTNVRVLSLPRWIMSDVHHRPLIAVVRNRTTSARACIRRQRVLVVPRLRNCRGGPPWPPQRGSTRWQPGAATEGRPYSCFISFVFYWLIVGMLNVSAQQQQVPIYGKVVDPNDDAIQHASVEFESEGNTTRTITDLSGDFTVLSARAYGSS